MKTFLTIVGIVVFTAVLSTGLIMFIESKECSGEQYMVLGFIANFSPEACTEIEDALKSDGMVSIAEYQDIVRSKNGMRKVIENQAKRSLGQN